MFTWDTCTIFLKLLSGVLSCCLKFNIPVAFNFDYTGILKSEMIEGEFPLIATHLATLLFIKINSLYPHKHYTLYNCIPCDNVHFHLQTTEDKTIVKVNTDISHSVYFENDKFMWKWCMPLRDCWLVNENCIYWKSFSISCV